MEVTSSEILDDDDDIELVHHANPRSQAPSRSCRLGAF